MSDRFGLRVATMIAVFWTSGAASEAMAQASARPPFIEDEVGGVQIGRDRSDQVIRRYGPGLRVPGRGAASVAERLCYWDARQQVGLEFGTTELDDVVAMVMVTTMPDQLSYPCTVRGSTISAPVTTGKAVGPGDSVEKVLGLYGQPRQRREEQLGGKPWTILEYEAQHERTPGLKRWYLAIIAFVDGRLAALTIIESETSVTKAFRGK